MRAYDQDAPAPGANSGLNIGGVLYGDLSARTIGISTRAPQAALDIVFTGTASNIYAQLWRDGTGVVVASITSEGKLFADGSGLTGVGGGSSGPSIDISTINAAACPAFNNNQ